MLAIKLLKLVYILDGNATPATARGMETSMVWRHVDICRHDLHNCCAIVMVDDVSK